MGFIDHVHACNCHDPASFTPFRIDGKTVGLIRPFFTEVLQRWPDVFAVTDTAVALVVDSNDIEACSSAVAEVLRQLVDDGVLSHLHGEQYAATEGNWDQALLFLDRAAAPYFGTRVYGQNLNGFVRDEDGMKLWVARHSVDQIHYPGHLDKPSCWWPALRYPVG